MHATSSALYSQRPAMQPDPVTNAEFYEGLLIKRFLAWLVDLAVILGVTFAISLLTLGVGFFFFAFIYLAVGFLYRWSTLSGRSATWGMRLFGIELRDRQGLHFDSGNAFAWTLGYTLSWAFFPVQFVSIFLMVISSRGQGLTDHMLGSVVINRPA